MEIEKIKFEKIGKYNNYKKIDITIETISCEADRGCFVLMSESGAAIEILNGYGDGTFKAHFVKSLTVGGAIDYMWELLREPNRGIRMLNLASTKGIWRISARDCDIKSLKNLKETGGLCIGNNWTAYMDWDDHELRIAESW